MIQTCWNNFKSIVNHWLTTSKNILIWVRNHSYSVIFPASQQPNNFQTEKNRESLFNLTNTLTKNSKFCFHKDLTFVLLLSIQNLLGHTILLSLNSKYVSPLQFLRNKISGKNCTTNYLIRKWRKCFQSKQKLNLKMKMNLASIKIQSNLTTLSSIVTPVMPWIEDK